MNELDYNRDGVVTFDEFFIYHLSGRQGSSKALKAAKFGLLKAQKLLDAFKKEGEKGVKMSEYKTSSLDLSVNAKHGIEDPGVHVSAQIHIFSDEAKTLNQELASKFGHDEPKGLYARYSLALKPGFGDFNFIQDAVM